MDKLLGLVNDFGPDNQDIDVHTQLVKVLVIDDDASIRGSLTRAFSYKFDMLSADSGYTGLSLLDASVHCVILDIKMKELDGFETYRLLKEKSPDVPVIFFTAFQSEFDLIDIINTYKPDGYVEKGKDISLLENLVDNAIEKYKLIFKNHQYERELKKKIKALRRVNRELKEVNIALKVFFEQRESDRQHLENIVVTNVNERIFPYLDKLNRIAVEPKEKEYIKIMSLNLNQLISPFAQSLSSIYYNFTPTEVEISVFIKQGKQTKEIAKILNLSVKTIESYRFSIRKKLGIKNKKTNLREFLLTIQ